MSHGWKELMQAVGNSVPVEPANIKTNNQYYYSRKITITPADKLSLLFSYQKLVYPIQMSCCSK